MADSLSPLERKTDDFHRQWADEGEGEGLLELPRDGVTKVID